MHTFNCCPVIRITVTRCWAEWAGNPLTHPRSTGVRARVGRWSNCSSMLEGQGHVSGTVTQPAHFAQHTAKPGYMRDKSRFCQPSFDRSTKATTLTKVGVKVEGAVPSYSGSLVRWMRNTAETQLLLLCGQSVQRESSYARLETLQTRQRSHNNNLQ